MNKTIFPFFLLLSLGGFSLSSYAQDEGEPAPDEPEVTIQSRKTLEVEEFRSHGKVYMIKVHPKKGPPYYLIDADGDGNFDTRKNDLEPNLVIPSWVLFSW